MHALAFIALLGLLQDKQRDDIVQLKDGTLLVGKVVKIDDKGVTMELKNGGKVDRLFSDMMPSSAYRLKADRIDPKSAQAHFDLGEFCLTGGLWRDAAAEFDKAAELDASMAEKVAKKKAEVRNEEGRTKFEEAKRLVAEKKYEEARNILANLAANFGDTSYAAEAKKEMAKVADELKKENEARQRELEAKAKALEDKKVRKAEEGEKGVVNSTVEGLEDAKKLWAEGLDWESKGNLTRADRALKTAEIRLLTGKKGTESLSKSNDVEILKKSKDLDRELDAWLVRTYYRLGRMWATELNYTEALLWLNKGLRIAPDDHLLNEVLLTLTQLQMRKRAAGGGY
jgi:tetratricopeptide (TPR) repeat protein